MCRIFCTLYERRLCEITADSHKREIRVMVEMKCPHCVGTVTLLTHKKDRDVERIDIEMMVDKEDAAEKNAYQKIKEYVKEKYELDVYTNYIVEVKRKHGWPLYEAPNQIVVLKREYPSCPEEKMNAIKGTLKNFDMVG